MKKLIVLLTSGLMLSSMTSANGKEVNISNFCVDKFCLGDPASKFGGIASLKNYGTPPFKFTIPDCQGTKIGVITKDQYPRSASFIWITLSSYPKYLGDGVDSYYRISEITVKFPEVSSSDYHQLINKIFSRAGVEGERQGDRLMFLGLRWRAPKGAKFADVPFYGVSLGTVSMDGFSLRLDEDISSYQFRRDQKGCTNKPPNL